MAASEISKTEKETSLECSVRWNHTEIVKFFLSTCKFDVGYLRKCGKLSLTKEMDEIFHPY